MTFNISYDKKIFQKKFDTPILGLARATLALGTLITLLFTKIDLLFDKATFEKLSETNSYLVHINLFRIFGFENLYTAKIIAIVILISVIAGYFPRITGILHWWVAFSFNSQSILVDGGDQLTSVLTCLLIPVTILDGRQNHWRIDKKLNNFNTNLIGNGFLLIIGFQMSIVYLQAALDKLYKLNEWMSGTALYYYLNDPLFGAPDWLMYFIRPLLHSEFIFLLSWSVIILELLLFIAMFRTDSSKVILFYLGLLFHLAIIFSFGLVSFFFAMAGGLIIYLLPKDITLKQTINPIKLYRHLKM